MIIYLPRKLDKLSVCFFEIVFQTSLYYVFEFFLSKSSFACGNMIGVIKIIEKQITDACLFLDYVKQINTFTLFALYIVIVFYCCFQPFVESHAYTEEDVLLLTDVSASMASAGRGVK